MNTYSHILQTAAAARLLRPGESGLAASAAAGAALPDLPYLARAATMLARTRGRLTLAQALERLDYTGAEPSWAPDLALHSVLPLLPAAALAAAAPLPPRLRAHLLAFTAGWAGHVAADLGTHAGDARPPLWPVSGRRWHSPVSTWDPAAHAVPAAAAEHVLTALAAVSLLQQARRPRPALTVRPPAAARGGDRVAFAGRFLRHPARFGSVTPTSARAARRMLDMTDLRRARLVVELGAGTGVITRALLEATGPWCKILAFETDPAMYERLTARLTDPRLEIVNVSAADMTLAVDSKPDAIVSALPLTSMPATRTSILTQAARLLAPRGVFLAIQYTPARQRDLARHFGTVRRCWYPLNVPPAFLYSCTAPMPGSWPEW